MLKGKYDFSFTPRSIPGKAEDPLYQDQLCYGIDLRHINLEALVKSKKINLQWMIELYKNYPNKAKFFDQSIHRQIGNINFLAGDYAFKKQIEAGMSEAEIRKTWEPGLKAYKQMRKEIPTISVIFLFFSCERKVIIVILRYIKQQWASPRLKYSPKNKPLSQLI